MRYFSIVFLIFAFANIASAQLSTSGSTTGGGQQSGSVTTTSIVVNSNGSKTVTFSYTITSTGSGGEIGIGVRYFSSTGAILSSTNAATRNGNQGTASGTYTFTTPPGETGLTQPKVRVWLYRTSSIVGGTITYISNPPEMFFESLSPVSQETTINFTGEFSNNKPFPVTVTALVGGTAKKTWTIPASTYQTENHTFTGFDGQEIVLQFSTPPLFGGETVSGSPIFRFPEPGQWSWRGTFGAPPVPTDVLLSVVNCTNSAGSAVLSSQYRPDIYTHNYPAGSAINPHITYHKMTVSVMDGESLLFGGNPPVSNDGTLAIFRIVNGSPAPGTSLSFDPRTGATSVTRIDSDSGQTTRTVYDPPQNPGDQPRVEVQYTYNAPGSTGINPSDQQSDLDLYFIRKKVEDIDNKVGLIKDDTGAIRQDVGTMAGDVAFIADKIDGDPGEKGETGSIFSQPDEQNEVVMPGEVSDVIGIVQAMPTPPSLPEFGSTSVLSYSLEFPGIPGDISATMDFSRFDNVINIFKAFARILIAVALYISIVRDIRGAVAG